MSRTNVAARAVRDAEASAGDVAGNMRRALYLIERPDNISDVIEALEWASENAKSLRYRIDEALSATRELVTTSHGAGVSE